jgi:AraC family transcriptional regulator of adaptative response/methylated-DNA-[protein]-cysteine methyltransferase
MTSRWTLAPHPLGRLLVAATPRGLRVVSLGDADADLDAAFQADHPRAEFRRDDAELNAWVAAIHADFAGCGTVRDLPIDLPLTPFRQRVYEALRAIPAGSTRSYGELARALGLPGGARAVARCCATNPIALVIPCHRVIREDGSLGGYRWGLGRKSLLLERERAAAHQEDCKVRMTEDRW